MSMALYRYFLPLVSLAPPPGYTMTFLVPMPRIRMLAQGGVEALKVEQTVVRNGTVLDAKALTLPLSESGADARFDHYSDDRGEWVSGERIAFVETQMNAIGPGGFADQVAPSSYTIYSGPARKTLLSDNNLKYGDRNVITQSRQFGSWIGGYPAVELDPARDVDESFVVINPYERPALVTIAAPALGKTVRERVPARTGRRLSLAARLDPGPQRWRGHVFISGANRLVVFDCKHSRREPERITALEHLDLFRGDEATAPFSQTARRFIGERILHRGG